MKLIKEETLNKTVLDQLVWNFDVPENGVYIILISAKCKNWLQNYKRLFNDDDLAVQVDNYLFAEIKGKKREFSSPGSWNGNEIKGDTKKVFFLLPIRTGNHEIKFWVDGFPILEEIKIYKIDESQIDLTVDNLVGTSKYVDLIFKNLKIEKFNIRVKVQVGSNMEIRVDGKTEKNPKYKRFEKWYWYGQELMGKSKEYIMLDILDENLHFFQLGGKEKPEIESIKLKINLENIVYSSGFVKLYKDIIIRDDVNLRLDHTDESESLLMLRDGERVNILNEKVAGKYITNDSNIWHEVIVRGVKGYILSSFVEIGGQERDVIIFKIKDQAKIQGIDPDFAVALAGCESHYKPYAVSSSSALGIFQLTGIVRIDLEQRFNLKISDDECFEVDKNIIAGITYLKWLFGIYGGTKDEYKKITAAWNAGKSLIPVNGPINFEHIKDIKKKEEAKNLVNCVEKNRKIKNWLNLLFIIAVIIILGFGTKTSHSLILSKNVPLQAQVFEVPNLGRVDGNTKFVFEHPDFDPNIKSVTVTTSSYEPGDWITNIEFVIPGGTFLEEYPGALYNAYFDNRIGIGLPKLVIVRGEGHSIMTSMLEFNNWEKTLTKVDFIDKDGVRSDTLCCNYTILVPHKNRVEYDIGMPDFSANPKTINIYEYDYSKEAFVE